MIKHFFFMAGVWSLLPLLLVGQCSTNSDKLTHEQMTACKAEGLYGKVKSMTDTNGMTITFNERGDIINKKWKDGSEAVYSYTNPYQYTVDGQVSYKITFDGNKRIMTEASELDPPEHWIFDNQGRLIEKEFMVWPALATETYAYNGSEKLPNTMKRGEYDENGTYDFTETYQYITIDTYGNWTKRKVNLTEKTSEYVQNGEDKVTTQTKTYYETRTITYY